MYSLELSNDICNYVVTGQPDIFNHYLDAMAMTQGQTLKRMVWLPFGVEPSEMERVTAAIAEGDVSLTFNANATGVYAKLQHMSERLREVIGHIHQSSHRLSAVTEETSAISLQTSANLSRQ